MGSPEHEMTLYDLLQVSPRADAELIEAASRTLARGYNPDVSTDPDSERVMRELNAA